MKPRQDVDTGYSSREWRERRRDPVITCGSIRQSKSITTSTAEFFHSCCGNYWRARQIFSESRQALVDSECASANKISFSRQNRSKNVIEPAELAPQKYQLFIDGQWVDSESGKTFTTPNPSTGETLAEVSEADKADIDKAVIAARRAFEGKWSKISARDRGRMLYKLSQLIEAARG